MRWLATLRQFSRIAREENPGKPFILFGHSMGSFAAQQFAVEHSRELDGLILSGSGALDGLAEVAASAPPGTNILIRVVSGCCAATGESEQSPRYPRPFAIYMFSGSDDPGGAATRGRRSPDAVIPKGRCLRSLV